MHAVAVLAPRGAVGFDLTVACQAFALARLPDGAPPYEVLVCGDAAVTGTAAGVPCFELRPAHPLEAALGADTIVVPGVDGQAGQDPAVVDLLRRAADRNIRVASICTGAFLLAEAGLLDGAAATTHWLAAEQLARGYPAVRVDPGVLFVDNGQVLSSAGAAAGLDLCLHLISRDHGAAVAAKAARALVVPRRREGSTAQLVRPPVVRGGDDGGQDPLHATLDWLYRNLHRPLTLADVAREAGMSVRHLHRRFQALTGTTPLRWLLWARIERTRELLETTDLPVERLAGIAGFGSAVSLRAHFRRHTGTTPTAYRRKFRAPPGATPTPNPAGCRISGAGRRS
ncbi:GlxA family transcriptional regulator [Streptomyces boncukensis]|uniref:Helix-turn-helix domain-containing protein n=1 Tax=Streptomyces boncukensis TaxID=2711219 RepID=A0A6G4X213_9ACTN|nr:helix-turn-helix domain-containing protein [Streptomyces boncukensis]NGO71293.1 helix-turn-helix domain-containing protein [Streptomyces boncukensis]